MKLIILYSLYFLGLPSILLYFYLKLRSQNQFIDFLGNADSNQGKSSSKRTKKAEQKRKRTKIIFVVILILFLSSWHIITSELIDLRLKGEIQYGKAGMYTENPIVISLGPTYDVNKIIQTMKEEKDRWLPDQVERVVDLDILADQKGRIAVYRTYNQRYIITLTYLLPYPVVKSFGFQYVRTDDGKLKIVKGDKKTIFYPLDPGTADNTAKLK